MGFLTCIWVANGDMFVPRNNKKKIQHKLFK